MDIARGQLQGDDLIVVVEDEVQLEASPSCRAGPDRRMPVDAMIIARAVESMS